MKKRYFPSGIEPKWQKKWQEQGLYKFKWDEKKKKYYNLVELPYPSGDLHPGHWFSFAPADAHARYKRMTGFNVFFPNGFDAFGLPAENAAIKRGIHPKDWTMKNIENMTKQFQSMGTMIDWNYTAITCLPEYYKWNQWIFLKMFEKGIAYRGKALSNWCPTDQTVLANEHIEAGKCWRCGTEVIQKEVEQWFLAITKYADELIWKEVEKPNFVLIHGYKGSSDTDYHKWLSQELRKMGYKTEVPNLIKNNTVNLDENVDFLLKNCQFNLNTVIIAHSLGATLALKLLPKLKTKIAGLVLVAAAIRAGEWTDKEERPELDSTSNWNFDFEAIKNKVGRIVVVEDTNDDIIPSIHAKELAEKVAAEHIKVKATSSHFNSIEAPELLSVVLSLDNSQVDWPNQVKEAQNSWIGKSEGIIIDFDGIKVFTTRPETTDGATFLAVSPEHPFASKITTKEVQDYIEKAKSKTEMERKENKEKTGVFTGLYVQNPVTKEKIPVWVADYVLWGYGTGAIMAVPFADERDREFAEKFKIPIVKTSFKAKLTGEKKVNYHLHDWSVSRQRYWGTPVPIIHCPKDGAVAVPMEDLPVELPYNVDYMPKGKPPLASDEEWIEVKCPKCNGEAKRDAETLDTFFDSAWYYYRYVSPKFEKGPFDEKEVARIMPVDVYFGGSEHTVGHTLYARFFTKFFKDLEMVSFDEFALKRAQHGVILGPDGNRMSKSRGNVVNPDEVVKEYGADAVRLYLCFMMPYESTGPWSTSAISGIYRFLKRVWDLQEKMTKVSPSAEDLNRMHSTIKKVGEDLENLHFNTGIAAMMAWLNFLSGKKEIGEEEYETFIKLLSPFAPYITEEIWQSLNSSAKSIHLEDWPIFNPQYLVADEVSVGVQINGKIRDTIRVEGSKIKVQSYIEEEVRKSEKVKKYLENKQIKKVIYVEGKIINFVVA